MNHHDRKTFRILIVEDSRPTQVWVTEELERCKNGFEFELTFTSRLDESLQYVSSSDAVVLDLTLPDSDGVETLKKVRAVCSLVPIVVYTGSDNPKLWFEVGRHLASGLVVKDAPIAPALACLLGEADTLKQRRQSYSRRLREIDCDDEPQVFQQ